MRSDRVTSASPGDTGAIEPPLRFAVAAMGTRFELLLGAGEPDGMGRAVGEAVIEEIEGWHRRLTRFAPDSLLSHINRTAADTAVRLDAATFALFEDALAVFDESGGAFCITRAGRSGEIELDARARTVRFRGRGIALDLGAIAKGHALDHAVALLREHGVRNALLHGGTSSVVALGTPPGVAGWKVALGRDADAPTVTLRDTALSVSTTTGAGGGVAGAAPHILDPRSGIAAGGAELAAVIGPSARLADAWSTALAVLGTRPPALAANWTTCIRTHGRSDAWAGPDSPAPGNP